MSVIVPLARRFTGACVLALCLSGCVQQMEQLNRDLAQVNQVLANAGKPGQNAPAVRSGTTAVMPTPAQGNKAQETQLIVPTDNRVKDAMDQALPVIKKALSVHQCVTVVDGMLQLNQFALPGVDLRGAWGYESQRFPNSPTFMKYHDRSKCVSVRSIDNWSMPALNVLTFRAVYYADDSGETVSFGWGLKKTDNGSWALAAVERLY